MDQTGLGNQKFVNVNPICIILQRQTLNVSSSRLSSYRAVNTFRPGYENQSLSAVRGSNRCLFRHPYKTHKCTLQAECKYFGDFTKLQKATISFVMSVCLSVRMKQLGSHWRDFHDIWYLTIFRKSVQKTQVSLQADRNNEYFTWSPMYIYDIFRWILLKMKTVSDKSYRENQNTFYVQ